MSKLKFISIRYELNKTKKKLTELFIETLFKNKINFFYKINNFKFTKLKLLNYHIAQNNKKLSKKIIKTKYLNEKHIYLHNINFKNKKIHINAFNNYYNLRFLKKYISLAVQGFIVVDFYNYIIGKRKNVTFEKNLYEFIPSGSLTSFSKKSLYLQIKKETFEELNLNLNYKNVSMIGFYLDFINNVLDFIFKINLKNVSILKYKLFKSNEHSKILISKKNYLKKNINQFTNASKKIINKIIDE